MNEAHQRPGWTSDGRIALNRHPDINTTLWRADRECVKRHLLPLGLNDVEASTILDRGVVELSSKVKLEPMIISTSRESSAAILKQLEEDPEVVRADAYVHAMRVLRADVLRSAWYIVQPSPSIGLGPLPDSTHHFLELDEQGLASYIHRQTAQTLDADKLNEWSTSVSSRAALIGWRAIHGVNSPCPRAIEPSMRRVTAGMLLAFASTHQASDWAARTIAARELEAADPFEHLGPFLE